MNKKISIFWFRRDLRLEDNIGFLHALKGEYPVLPIFIFDKHILDKLPKNDARVTFIFDTLQKIRSELKEQYSSSIAFYFGNAHNIFKALLQSYDVQEVHANHDYEPYAKERDSSIKQILETKDIPFHTYKDQVIFEKDDITKDDGKPYVVYTPYKNKWKSKFSANLIASSD